MSASTSTPARTERYIYAAVQSLPEKQRADVAAELRASIQDAIDARVEQGVAADTAEADVLTEMGDPERLAAGYTGRRLYLIGPDTFLTYLRVLRQLLMIVLPILIGINVVADAIDGESLATIIGGAFETAFNISLHIVFWVTLVFAIIERYDPEEVRSLRTWTLDKLPDVTPRQISRADMLSGIAFAIVPIALIVLQTRRSFVTNDAGDNIPVLNPDLWSFWLPAFIALLLVSAVFEVVKYRVGRWTLRLALSNLALNAAFVVLAGWLALNERLINPEVYTVVEWSGDFGGDDPLGLAALLAILVICAWDTAEGFYSALRRTPDTTSLTAPI